MADIFDLLKNLQSPFQQGVGSGNSILDKILQERQGTQPLNAVPGTDVVPPMGVPPIPGTGGGTTPVPNQPQSSGGLLSPLLEKLGPIGSGIQKAGTFVNDIANDPNNQAALGVLAPSFAANKRLQEEMAIKRQLADAATARSAPNSPSNTNVQSTFQGQNGNIHIVKRNGEVSDSGIPFNSNVQLIEQDDGSVVALDKSTGERLGTPITTEEAQAAKSREQRREDRTESAIELPEALATLDTTITKADATVAKIDGILDDIDPGETGLRGSITSRIPGTGSFDLNAQIKSLQANLGFEELQRMRAASKSGGALGQVSERELELLISAVNAIDPKQSEKQLRKNLRAVKTHYDNYKREIEIMKNKMRERAGQPAEEAPQDDFSAMSDEELRAIINGQ